jgi:hypothetical protein
LGELTAGVAEASGRLEVVLAAPAGGYERPRIDRIGRQPAKPTKPKRPTSDVG